MIRKLAGGFGVLILISVIVAGILAYLVVAYDPHTKTYHDGLGRELTEAPWLLALILPVEDQWAGWKWWLIDMVVFWGGIAAGANLSAFGFQATNKSEH